MRGFGAQGESKNPKIGRAIIGALANIKIGGGGVSHVFRNAFLHAGFLPTPVKMSGTLLDRHPLFPCLKKLRISFIHLVM